MLYWGAMRTTLSIDDDVLAAAKARADHERRSVGALVSDLLRQSLFKPVALKSRNGVPLLPTRDPSVVITLEMVNRLRDEEP
jgi:hypothetical protein